MGRRLVSMAVTIPVVNLDTQSGHSYGLIEIFPGSQCLYTGYTTCQNYYFKAEVDVTVGESTISGSGTQRALSIDKSNYVPGDDMTVVCAVPGDTFDFFDITGGDTGGASLGEYPCGPSDTITFDAGEDGHTYAVVEVVAGNQCFILATTPANRTTCVRRCTLR